MVRPASVMSRGIVEAAPAPCQGRTIGSTVRDERRHASRFRRHLGWTTPMERRRRHLDRVGATPGWESAEARHASARAAPCGVMLWFRRKTLSGSYFALRA